jgi:hypothetical protein
MRFEVMAQGLQRASLQARIAVEQKHNLCRTALDRPVSGCAIATILTISDEPDRWKLSRNHLVTAIGGSVINYNDSILGFAEYRTETISQDVTGVVVYDANPDCHSFNP